METLSQLADVSLQDQLTNCLNESLGLQINKNWDETLLHGQLHELYYVEITAHETKPAILKQFIQEWTPVLEQLSLFHDYHALRLEITSNNSYNVVEQLENLLNDVNTPKVELWMDPTSRAQFIHQLDDTIFENNKISKNHLHYIASNTLSIKEIYGLIEQKINQNNFMNYSISEQTQLKLKESFETLHKAIHHYQVNQEIEILYSLVDKLEDFYAWLKGLITTMKVQVRGK